MSIPKIDETKQVSVFPGIPNGLLNRSADNVQDEEPEQGTAQPPYLEEAVALDGLRKHGGGK